MPEMWLASFIKWTLWLIVMSLFMGWLHKSRTRARPPSQAGTMKQPGALLFLGWIGLLFSGGITIASTTFWRNETTTVGTTSMFLGFTLFAIVLILECYRSQHHYDKEGLHYGKLFGRRGYTRWDAIRHADHNTIMKWLVLRTEAGTTIRVSTSLTGWPGFARRLLPRVNPTALTPKAKDLLQKAAKGELPPV